MRQMEQRVQSISVPVSDHTTTLDAIRFRFYSETTLIRWAFIYKFARLQVRRTQRGITGVYDMYYHHLPSGKAILIIMDIIQVAAAAR